MLPVYLIANGRSYTDDGTLDRDRVYSHLEVSSTVLGSAAPTPEDFRAAYQRLLASGADKVLGIFVAARMSSLFSNAILGAEGFPEGTVRVVDSSQISMGLGWQAVMAAEALQQGRSVEEAAALVESVRDRSLVFGVVDSLEHLRRGGRVSLAAAWVGSLLRVKPILVFEGGRVRVAERVRSMWRAVDHVVRRVSELGPLERLAIIHSRADKAAIRRLESSLASATALSGIPVIEVGPVFASHVGPGGLGVALVHDGHVDTAALGDGE